MKASPRENAEVAANERRTVSVNQHALFIDSLLTQDDLDDLDRELDDMIVIDPYAGDPPSRRSDKEIGRLLDILDSIDNSKNPNTERGSL